MSDAVVDLLRQAFDAAVASAQPQLCVPPFIPAAPKGRLIVLGAGKASAAMARAVELHAPCAVSGLVVTRYGHAVDCEHIEIVQAAHPRARRSRDAGRRAHVAVGARFERR